jgi:hypothetical protein
MKKGWSDGGPAMVFLALCVVALGVAGCGGGGGGSSSTGGNARLSKSAYRNQLAKISRQANAAHAAVGQAATKAKNVAQVQTALRNFAAAEDRMGGEVSKLSAPRDAEAANAELARGEHDDAAEIRALLPKLAKYKSAQQAFGYLQRLGHTKGGQEEDEALSKLKSLGYTRGS